MKKQLSGQTALSQPTQCGGMNCFCWSLKCPEIIAGVSEHGLSVSVMNANIWKQGQKSQLSSNYVKNVLFCLKKKRKTIVLHLKPD